MVTREEVYRRARQELETPWVHQGRTPGVALDCVGLGVITARSLGIEIGDSTNYRRNADWVEFSKRMAENGEWRGNTFADAIPGTVLALREGKYHTHCGIVGNLNGVRTLIHAYFIRGKVVEEPLTPWANRIIAVYLFRGVE